MPVSMQKNNRSRVVSIRFLQHGVAASNHILPARAVIGIDLVDCRAVMVVRMRRGSKLGNERCPDRQHAADADAGGSKNDPKPGKNGNREQGTADATCSPKFISLFSLCYLLLEKLSKPLILLSQNDAGSPIEE